MLELLLQVLWFLGPAAAANTVPPLAARLLPRWSWPLDGGRSFRGQRILGDHKTVRGLVAGVLAATAVHGLQCLAAEQWRLVADLAVQPAYHDTPWLGAWLGFAALAGDAVKSFCKRQWQIAPGRSWIPWDQIDWIIGTLLAGYFLLRFDGVFVVLALATGFVFTGVGRIVGYWLGINDTWL